MSSRQPTSRLLLALAASVLAVCAPGHAQNDAIGPAFCAALPADPLPTGVTAAPPDTFADPFLFAPNPAASNDYHWTHSSVHLQGAAATQKWGACLFFNPNRNLTGPVDMTDWRSALVINNPSPTLTATVQITFRNPQGLQLGPVVTTTLAPEATFVRGAVELQQFGGGIGSVEVTADVPITGATLHRFARLMLSNGQQVVDPDQVPFTPLPGAASMQQLQMSQDSATSLFAGPFPISNMATEDFLNGVLPITCVLNPNPTPTTVTVASLIAPARPLFTRTVNLPAFGMLLDTSLWGAVEPAYLSTATAFDLDLLTAAFSNGNPLLGDFLMVDVFGNGGAANLEPGRRFRMGSGMMQNAPARRLVNPEHIETGLVAGGALPSTPPVQTLMSVANTTGADIGPVTVEFFPRGAGPTTTFTFPSLPAFSVQRITPSTLGIPERFAGWARITACAPGLIGWTMREIEQQTAPPFPAHFRKVYGEELDGANGGEPGAGFPVQVAGQPVIRKVAPLLRAAGNSSQPNWWPSFVIGANHASANIGPYTHRYFTLPGVLAGQTAFAGLQFGDTSFTYVDPIVNLIGVNSNLSGRFDRQGGQAVGIEAIGDPLAEWQIPMFLGPDVPVFPPDDDADADEAGN